MAGQFIWKLVGGRSTFDALNREVAERNLHNVVHVAERLPRGQAFEGYGWVHANVAPTTALYSEGLAMTAAEAVLAGRPVVLNTVVPAWEIIGDAAIKAETGNLNSFVEAFRKLVLEPDYYDHCRRATMAAQQQFYETSGGLGAADRGPAQGCVDRDPVAGPALTAQSFYPFHSLAGRRPIEPGADAMCGPTEPPCRLPDTA